MTVLSQPQPINFALQQFIFIHNLSRGWNLAAQSRQDQLRFDLSY
jgi:hypothetical protein